MSHYLQASWFSRRGHAVGRRCICLSPFFFLLKRCVIAIHVRVVPVVSIVDASSAWAAGPAK